MANNTSNHFKYLFISTMMIFSTSCSQSFDQLACLQGKAEMQVSFIGGISAGGMIKLEPKGDTKGAVQVTAVIMDPAAQQVEAAGNSGLHNQDKILMVINGVGQCEGGVISARFGADAGKNSDYKIEGGRMTAVLDKRQTDTKFGYWEMSLISNAGSQQTMNETEKSTEAEPKKPRNIKLSGFWKDITGYAPSNVAVEAHQH